MFDNIFGKKKSKMNIDFPSFFPKQRNVKPTQVVGDNNKRTLRQINRLVLYLPVTEDGQQKSYGASADIV